jgi:hypothetical protein
MLTWMRVRGCSWRHGAEMGAAMLLPALAALVLYGLGALDMLPWLANSEHAVMLLGMLLIMLYRREHYTNGYSFFAWPGAANRRRSLAGQLAGARQPSRRSGAG